MAEGSSVDSTVLEEGEEEPDGLNITSEILKEDEDYDNSRDSFLEDSIHKRAAKALNLGNIKELLPQQQSNNDFNRSCRKARAESLVNVIITSMATDMRRVACSVSSSPNRLSRRTSRESGSVCSTSGSTSTPTSRMNSTPKSDMLQPKRFRRNEEYLSEEMQHICNLELPNDDSLLSEPELDLAFNQPQQTMDILAAAGNLQERRGVHGGYGTPSSYASEQEMKLYFDSTPNPDIEQDSLSNDNFETSRDERGDTGLHTIALLETKMQNEIISDKNCDSDCREPKTMSKTDQKDNIFELDKGNNNKPSSLSSAATLCSAAVQKLEDYAKSDDESWNTDQSSRRKIKDKMRNSKKSPTGLSRRNSDGNVDLRTLVKKRSRKPDAKTRLSKMLKSASESLIDSDLSDAMVINLTIPDLSQIHLNKEEFAPFDSFQECLKQLKSFDCNSVANESCDDYISEDYSPRSDFSFKDDSNQIEDQCQKQRKASKEIIHQAIVDESFVNESIAQTYHSPLFEDYLSDHRTDSSDSSYEIDKDNFRKSPGNSSEESGDFEIDKQELSLDLRSLDGSEVSDDEVLNDKHFASIDMISQSSQSESPIYFERDNDRIDSVSTARRQQTFTTDEINANTFDELNLCKSSYSVEDTDVHNNNNASHSSFCETHKKEERLEYYHTGEPEETYIKSDLGNADETDTCLLPNASSSRKQHDREIDIISEYAHFLVNEVVKQSGQNMKKLSIPEEIDNESEVMAQFANEFADEIINHVHLNRKDLALGLCCDSESESGYSTTNESKSTRKSVTEPIIVVHYVEPTISQPFVEKNISKPILCQDADLTSTGGSSGCTSEGNLEMPPLVCEPIVVTSPTFDRESPNQQLPNVSEVTVFEAKASAFASSIKAYEEYEPHVRILNDLTNEPVGKERVLDQKSLDEVAKDHVVQIIKDSLMSLQQSEVSFSPASPAKEFINPNAENLTLRTEADSKPTPIDSSIDAKYNLLKHDDAKAEKDFDLDDKGSQPPRYFAKTGKSQTSSIPKILVTCPSVDIVDEDVGTKREFVAELKAAVLEDPERIDLKNKIHKASEKPRSDTTSSMQQIVKPDSDEHSIVANNDEVNYTSDHAWPVKQALSNNKANGYEEKSITDSSWCSKNLRTDFDRDYDYIEDASTSKAKGSNCLDSVTSKKSNKEAARNTLNEQFAINLKCKYKGLDEQIDRILNPTPSPPPISSNFLEDFGDERETILPHTEAKRVRFQHNADAMHFRRRDFNESSSGVPRRLHSSHNMSSMEDFSKRTSPAHSSSKSSPHRTTNQTFLTPTMDIENSQHLAETKSNDFRAISEILQYIKENLNRNDESVRRLEENIRTSWVRMLALDEAEYTKTLDDDEMSRTPRDGEGTNKVRALEEVVGLLKKHIHQRESEINGLGSQLRQSNEKIKTLESKLKDQNLDEIRMPGLREDRSDITKELKSIQKERDGLQKQIKKRIIEKEDAQVATHKARSDLDFERQKIHGKNTFDHHSTKLHRSKKEELRGRVDELEFLNKSSNSDFERAELDLGSIRRENRSLRAQNDQNLVELKTDNTIMREKLDRMNEISAENLLLQSDAADFQAELSDLRTEAKHLRSKCYELTEDNRQNKAEIRDLRRYVELLKSNKTGDSRQDLLSKIEYYQMEHDRLMDEIRRLKQRLGEVSPRSPHQRPPSPRVHGHASYPGPTSRSSPPTVTFSKSLERGRSPVSDAIAASTASSLAAVRLVKERCLSPSAALNIRDLTMDRYNQHLDGRESPGSIDSDSTELLLKPQSSGHPGTSAVHTSVAPYQLSDDDEDDYHVRHKTGAKLSDSYGSNHGRVRSSSRDSIGCSPCKRSCSPTNPGGFRSISPKMTSTQNAIPDTARDCYPTKIKKSLPRRAFAPRSPADLKLGYCIKFTRPGGRLSRGIVKYIGHLPTRSEIFIGVELDGYDGKHSGTFQGTKYFTCPTNKGIFTPFSKVIMAWE